MILVGPFHLRIFYDFIIVIPTPHSVRVCRTLLLWDVENEGRLCLGNAPSPERGSEQSLEQLLFPLSSCHCHCQQHQQLQTIPTQDVRKKSAPQSRSKPSALPLHSVTLSPFYHHPAGSNSIIPPLHRLQGPEQHRADPKETPRRKGQQLTGTHSPLQTRVLLTLLGASGCFGKAL